MENTCKLTSQTNQQGQRLCKFCMYTYDTINVQKNTTAYTLLVSNTCLYICKVAVCDRSKEQNKYNFH